MAADLVSIAETVILTQFLTPAAKNIGEVALAQAKQVGRIAISYLAAVGREPQPVEPKLLLPLVQAASLETDESLTTYWAALLANAADPTHQVIVQPGFIEVLRQLSPVDTQLLPILYHTDKPYNTKPIIWALKSSDLLGMLGLDHDQVSLLVGNLMRLQLCQVVGELGMSPIPQYISGTPYGVHFLSAVAPPMPTSAMGQQL